MPDGQLADVGATVLVVEDDPSVAEILTTSLGARGYTVVVTRTVAATIRIVDSGTADLLLLDLGLPDGDGLDVCRHVRAGSDLPIIVLTAEGDERRKVEALDAGADDYVTKPFSMPELMARLRVADRHRLRGTAAAPKPTRLEVGNVSLDTDGRVVTVDGTPVRMTAKEFGVLEVLLRSPGRLLTHDEIIEHAWGPAGGTTGSLRVHLTNIRRKLGTGAGVELRTEPGIGYRLVVSPPGS